MLARTVLVVAAVAAMAYLGFALTAETLERRGAAPGEPGQDPARVVADRQKELHRAQELGPNDEALLREGRLLLYGERPRDAVRVLERAVAEQPESWRAWIALAQASSRVDPELSARAAGRARSLRRDIPR